MKVMLRKYGNVFKNDVVVLNVAGGYELREGYSFIAPSFIIGQKTNFNEFLMNFQYRH